MVARRFPRLRYCYDIVAESVSVVIERHPSSIAPNLTTPIFHGG
jgi:hypothetical protein